MNKVIEDGLMLEYTIATVLTGVAIISSSLFRARKFTGQKNLIQHLEKISSGHTVDFDGKIQYVGCFSHQWVVDNITKEAPGRIRLWIRKQVDASPLFVISLFGFFAITVSIALVYLFFISVVIIGGEIGIYFVGALIIVGTGASRISEELLDVLQKTNAELLTWKDYVYARIARRTFINSLVITGFLGCIFIVLSPWARVFVLLLAQGIATFSDQIILLPAMTIAEINMGLAFLYMASVLPLLAYFAVKLIEVLVRRYQSSGIYNSIRLS